MRIAFIDTLCKIAEKDERIFLITGDLGFSILERFRDLFPTRFINAGVAESNMIGIAAGLSLSGKIVYVYSIIPFLTMRCFEQISNDLCQQMLNVKLVGVGSGFSYGTAGPTHHAIFDISIMRSLPNMTVVCPGDPIETKLAIEASVSWQYPMYIRLGRGDEDNVYENIPHFKIGKGIVLKNGKDITVITTGNMLNIGKQVAGILSNKGVSTQLISMHTVKPLDKQLILKIAQETKIIFSLEEHSLIGGLGSAISEVLAELPYKVHFKRIALPDVYAKEVGNQNFLREKYGLSTKQIFELMFKEYNRIKNEEKTKQKSNFRKGQTVL